MNKENDIRNTELITEQPSRFDHLEQMSVLELLQHINEEDRNVAKVVSQAIPQIEALVAAIEPKMRQGGRLFYIGAGTSGRLGVLDASELPPTFGVPETWVMGIIAGGDQALRHAVERAEDISEQGWKDLLTHHPTQDDSVIGIAASGTTPYVVGTIRQARKNGLKMVLNMISTTLMIRLGRVQGNRMVNMQLTNDKLINRGTRMLQESLGLSYEEAHKRLLEAGSVSRCL